MSYEIHFEVKSSQELLLLPQDIPCRDSLVSNLVRDDSRVQRENVLVL